VPRQPSLDQTAAPLVPENPSSMLRADDETRDIEYRELVDDLKKVAGLI
jgi:hypothetical protein